MSWAREDCALRNLRIFCIVGGNLKLQNRQSKRSSFDYLKEKSRRTLNINWQ